MQILGLLPRTGIKWIAGTHRQTEYRLVETAAAAKDPTAALCPPFARVFQEDATVPRQLSLVAKQPLKAALPHERTCAPRRAVSDWCSTPNRHDECDGIACECHCHVIDATVLRREYGAPRLLHVAGERAL